MNNNLAKNIIYKLILNIFNICLPLIVSPYVLRVIGPENLGRINYAESIYTYFFAFASFGVYQYGIREVAKYRENKEKLSEFFTSCFVINLISSISMLIIYIIFIRVNQSLDSLQIILIVYSINIFSNIFYVEWANEGFENYKFITVKTVVIRIIYVVGIFALVRKQEDFIYYVILNVLFILFNNLTSFIFIKKNIGFNFKNLQIHCHIKYLLAGFIICNYGILFYQIDKTMLGTYGSELDVSLYSISNMIMFMILTMIQTILTVSVPRLVKTMSDDSEEYNNLLNKLYKIYCMFTFPAAIGVIILSKYILIFYGGSQYIDANLTLKLFSIFMIIINIEMFIRNQVLYINGKEKIIAIYLLIAGVVNLVGNKIAIINLQLKSEGAILATIIASILLLTLEYIYILKNMKFKFKIISKDILKYIVSSLTFIPIYILLNNMIKNEIIVFILTIVLCVVSYFTMLAIFKDEFVYSILKMKSKKLTDKK
ncbi:flippase [Paraclostridium bifermentans]|uniref:flippase n=1 Tax=Paraclostridium bifermentans TaxID=1490 RepID=UPI00359C8722